MPGGDGAPRGAAGGALADGAASTFRYRHGKGAPSDIRMKYVFRLLWLILTQRRRPRCDALGSCKSHFRVWPNDLDVLLHMNNGAYLTMADLGRTDLMLRADLFDPVRRRGWYPVMAAETIRFRRSLTLWQRYTITTRILGWSDRSIYIEQVFERGDELVAEALIDARFLARDGGRVASADVVALAGADGRSPPLPARLVDWIASVEAMRTRR